MLENLTDVERALLRAAEAGEWLVASELNEESRLSDFISVRADIVQDLVSAQPYRVDAKGVRIKNVVISGNLNLDDVEVRRPLVFYGCYFDHPVSMRRAICSEISFESCAFEYLLADGVHVKHNLTLRQVRAGFLELTGSAVGGDFSVEGARLAGGDGVAVKARRMRVGGDAILAGRFRADGILDFSLAVITGRLGISGAIATTQGYALIATAASFKGGVFFGPALTLDGGACLDSAEVTIGIMAEDSKFVWGSETAFSGNNLEVKGDVYFTSCQFIGMLRLMGASIDGLLHLAGSVLRTSRGACFNGQHLSVGGSIYMRDNFRSLGLIVLTGAKIGGWLTFQGACLNSELIDAQNIEIGENLAFDPGAWTEDRCRMNG